MIKPNQSMKTPFLTSSFFIALLGIFALSGCDRRAQPDSAANMVIALESPVVTLDPMRATEVFSGRVVTQIYEGLVGLDANNRVVPVLAERWEASEDFRKWTFYVRPGVLFHPHPLVGDGRAREVTAADAAFSLTRLVSGESPFAFALLDAIEGAADYNQGNAETVSGIVTVDDHTLELRLNFPDPFFVNRMTSQVFGIYPPEAVALGADIFGTSVAVGTGPFRMTGRRQDNRVHLEQNPQYWGTVAGNVEAVEFRVVQNDSIRLSDLRNGHIHLAHLSPGQLREVFMPDSIPSGDFEFNRTWRGRFEVARFDVFNSHFLSLNNASLEAPLRRAITLAVDREAIVRAVTFGAATVAPGPLPIAMHGYTPAHAADIHDLDAAAEALASSAFDSAVDRLEIIVHGREGARAVGELLQNQLRGIGIQADLVELDFNEAFMRQIQGDYQAAVFFFEYVFSTSGPILENFFLPGRIPNIWNYDNPVFSERVLALRGVSEPAAMNREVSELEAILVAEAASAFLFQQPAILLFPSASSGVRVNGHGMPMLKDIRLSR